MSTVFFYEAFTEEADALRHDLPESISADFTDRTIQESGHSRPPCPIISTRTQSVLPVAWAGELDGILTRSTGYDHITAYRQAAGVQVPAGYLPLYCARAVAEQAMLLWMALLRKLPRQMHQFQTFHRNGLTGNECLRKNLLVVGVGNIGTEVVRIGQGLSMQVRGVDLVHRHPDLTYVEPEAGMGWADIIVCAMNLTEQNQGYFSQSLLAKAKKGALFVNIARGELSLPSDLLALIKHGHLGGIALDVYDAEAELAVALRSGEASTHPQVQAIHMLRSHDNVILTPHNAFNTEESVLRKSEQSVQQLTHFLRHHQFLWPVSNG